jgi:hypothetical protein
VVLIPETKTDGKAVWEDALRIRHGDNRSRPKQCRIGIDQNVFLEFGLLKVQSVHSVDNCRDVLPAEREVRRPIIGAERNRRVINGNGAIGSSIVLGMTADISRSIICIGA